jgi:molybdopterin-containing oxidoreductase family membrane subunit
MEFFTAWYSNNPYEQFHFLHERVGGPYKWFWVCMTSFNVISPQFFWFKYCRRNLWIVAAVCMCVNAGMWFERFVIIVVSIHRDFLPSSWGMFYPTWVDKVTFIGTFGLFLSLFLLFIRALPMIAIAEVKGVTPMADPHSGHAQGYGYAAGPEHAALNPDTVPSEGSAH